MPTLRELFPDAKPVPTEPHLRAADMVAASRQTRRVLTVMKEQRVPIGNNLIVDEEQVKAWPAPWFVRPTREAEVEGPLLNPEATGRQTRIEDYESDTGILDHISDVSGRLRAVLTSHPVLQVPLEKMGFKVSPDEVNRLVVIMATEIVRQAVGIQVGAVMAKGAINIDSIVRNLEAVLRLMNKDAGRIKRPLYVPTPISPLWKDHQATKDTGAESYPITLLSGTMPEKNIASHLLSSIPATKDQPAVKRLPLIIQEAVPELLVPHRHHLEFLYPSEREQLKVLLEGKEVFTDDLRSQCVRILSDMLADLPDLVSDTYELKLRSDHAAWLSEKVGETVESTTLPAPFDAEAREVIPVYVDPLLAMFEQGDPTVLPALKRRLPLIAGMVARRIMELSRYNLSEEEKTQVMHELPILYGYSSRISRMFGGNEGAVQNIPELLADAQFAKYTNKLKTSI